MPGRANRLTVNCGSECAIRFGRQCRQSSLRRAGWNGHGRRGNRRSGGGLGCADRLQLTVRTGRYRRVDQAQVSCQCVPARHRRRHFAGGIDHLCGIDMHESEYLRRKFRDDIRYVFYPPRRQTEFVERCRECRIPTKGEANEQSSGVCI